MPPAQTQKVAIALGVTLSLLVAILLVAAGVIYWKYVPTPRLSAAAATAALTLPACTATARARARRRRALYARYSRVNMVETGVGNDTDLDDEEDHAEVEWLPDNVGTSTGGASAVELDDHKMGAEFAASTGGSAGKPSKERFDEVELH